MLRIFAIDNFESFINEDFFLNKSFDDNMSLSLIDLLSSSFAFIKRKKIDIKDLASWGGIIKKNIVEIVKKKITCEVLIPIRDLLIIGKSRVLRI